MNESKFVFMNGMFNLFPNVYVTVHLFLNFSDQSLFRRFPSLNLPTWKLPFISKSLCGSSLSTKNFPISPNHCSHHMDVLFHAPTPISTLFTAYHTLLSLTLQA